MCTETPKSFIPVEQELNIIKQFRNGDPAAVDQLTVVYGRFVDAVAKEYQNQGLDMAKLIAEGNKGLLKAAEKYDETRSYRFLSYAVWWIRQSILQALAHHNRN
jgi:RNA polymerase primary sigma factor